MKVIHDVLDLLGRGRIQFKLGREIVGRFGLLIVTLAKQKPDRWRVDRCNRRAARRWHLEDSLFLRLILDNVSRLLAGSRSRG